MLPARKPRLSWVCLDVVGTTASPHAVLLLACCFTKLQVVMYQLVPSSCSLLGSVIYLLVLGLGNRPHSALIVPN